MNPIQQCLLSLIKLDNEDEFQSENLASGVSEYLLFFRSQYKSGFKVEVNKYRERMDVQKNCELVPLNEHRLSSTRLHSIHEMPRRSIIVVRRFQKKSGVEKNEQ